MKCGRVFKPPPFLSVCLTVCLHIQTLKANSFLRMKVMGPPAIFLSRMFHPVCVKWFVW